MGVPKVAVAIPAGDRLRIDVASSNYDRFDVNMQGGSSLSVDPSPAHLALVEGKPERAHEMELRAGRQTGASRVAGVPGDLGRHEGNVDARASRRVATGGVGSNGP